MFSRKTDQQLIQSAVAGNERAWLNLVTRYEKRLYNYAFRMSGNGEDAMDIMQDVFVSVYRNLKNYRGEGEFPAWLFRIASFRCIDYFRRRQFHMSVDEMELFDESGDHQPELDLATAQSNRDMTELLSRLPLDQRHVVELKYFQNFTFEEIGGQLGISSNTAKTRLYAALGKMKKQAKAAPQTGAS